MFLGLARGFRALREAGLIDHLPRLYAVQTAACDPIVRAWEQGLNQAAQVEPRPGVADGIGVAVPVHGAEILASLRETGGAALRVDDQAVLAAQQALHHRGLMVEPTSAVPAAALDQIASNGRIGLILTGNGLKSL